MSEPNAQDQNTPAELDDSQEGAAQPQGGAQPSGQGQDPNPPQDNPAGSQTPTIPKPRFDEVNTRMQSAEARARQLEQELALLRRPQGQVQAPQDPFALPDENDPKYAGNWQAYLDDRSAVIARREFQSRHEFTQANNQVQSAWRGLQQAVHEEAAQDPTAYELPQVLAHFQSNPPLVLTIMESPDKVGILRYLRTNPQEIGRIQYMHPHQQLVELGMIRAKLAGSKGQPAKVSQMPAPMNPVGAGKGGQAPEGKYTQEQVIEKLYGKIA